MSIVFFGTPRFSIPSLDALLEAGEYVTAVVTGPDKRRGRGPARLPSPVKEHALKRGLQVLQPTGMKEEGFIDKLKALKPEFLLVVAFGRILPQELLDLPSLAPVNLHASLLPLYRGAAPMAWAIINGERETGLTTMLMSAGLDEGDILLTAPHRIMDDDTAESLGERLSAAGGPLLVRTLRGLREGTVRPRPQEGEPSYAPPLRKEDGRVDWSGTAIEIYNFTRGVHPWPGAFCNIGGRRTRLLRVRPLEGQGEAGVIKALSYEFFTVGTGKGLISVLELQPEGRRAMSARAFLQGRGLRAGTRVT
jgi:methionyl-tRNA formyltransferase